MRSRHCINNQWVKIAIISHIYKTEICIHVIVNFYLKLISVRSSQETSLSLWASLFCEFVSQKGYSQLLIIASWNMTSHCIRMHIHLLQVYLFMSFVLHRWDGIGCSGAPESQDEAWCLVCIGITGFTGCHIMLRVPWCQRIYWDDPGCSRCIGDTGMTH